MLRKSDGMEMLTMVEDNNHMPNTSCYWEGEYEWAMGHVRRQKDEIRELKQRIETLKTELLAAHEAMLKMDGNVSYWQRLAEGLQCKLGASDDNFSALLTDYVAAYNANLIDGEEPIDGFEMTTIIEERFIMKEVANARA